MQFLDNIIPFLNSCIFTISSSEIGLCFVGIAVFMAVCLFIRRLIWLL